jgi:hypothetical protein
MKEFIGTEPVRMYSGGLDIVDFVYYFMVGRDSTFVYRNADWRGHRIGTPDGFWCDTGTIVPKSIYDMEWI